MNSHEVDSCWTPVSLVWPAADNDLGIELRRKIGIRCGETGGVGVEEDVVEEVLIMGDVGNEWLLFLSRNPCCLLWDELKSKLDLKLRKDIVDLGGWVCVCGRINEDCRGSSCTWSFVVWLLEKYLLRKEFALTIFTPGAEELLFCSPADVDNILKLCAWWRDNFYKDNRVCVEVLNPNKGDRMLNGILSNYSTIYELGRGRGSVHFTSLGN